MTVSCIYLFTCVDKTITKPEQELSAEDRTRCWEITDALFKMFDTDGDEVIDGYEIKRALEDLKGFFDEGDH